jgi:hypothetical protein
MHAGFWWANLKESSHMENQGTDGRLINPLNAGLNPICHLLALLGTHPILHVTRIRIKLALTQAGRAFSGLLWLRIGTKYGFS